MKNERLKNMQQDYEQIPIPNDLRQIVENSIQEAKKEEPEMKKSKISLYIRRTAECAAAILIVITIMVNSGASVAHAMTKIPVIGAIAEIVTFREYKNVDNNMEADVKIPQVSVKDESGSVLEESTQKINKSIEEYTDEIIAQYESDVKEADGEGHMDVKLDYTVITNSDRLFSIRFDQLLVMASGTQMVKIYHIDKSTGEMMDLSGLFQDGADFAKPISDNIKEQMKAQMDSDENLVYWVDSDTPEWDFKTVTSDTTFYINENGKLVIVFDEYEVAPGYMGSVEFEIPTEVVKDIVQDGFLE